MDNGYELRMIEGKGDGIVACGTFRRGQLVMRGVIERELLSSTSHSSQIGPHRHVLHAGFISKVNHSCTPNCGVRVNATGAHDFVAFRDILPGEELTFDYAMRNYWVEHFPQRCMCGTPQCRGYITGWRSLPAKTKQAYVGFVAPYLMDMDARGGQGTSVQLAPVPPSAQ